MHDTSHDGIVVDGLSKSYGSERVVDDVSFTADRGTITGLVGPNGAGKSTTLRMMLGLVQPDAGRATFAGHRYADLVTPRCVVGVSFATPAAHPALRISDHLEMVARASGLGPERATEVARDVGLETIARRRIKTLSLGMAQRLSLAEALIGSPEFLLLDEPFVGLDVDGIRWFRVLLQTLADRGTGVLLSHHHMTEMEALAESLVIIGRGRVLLAGDVDDIIAGAPPCRVRVRCDDTQFLSRELRSHGFVTSTARGEVNVEIDDRLGDLGRILSPLGVHPAAVERVPSTLEDVFVHSTRQDSPFRARGGTMTEQHYSTTTEGTHEHA